MKRTTRIAALILSISLLNALSALAAEPNTLTPDEQSAGWKLLFDGKTSAGWVSIGKAQFPATGWGIVDGALVRQDKGGDIVTAESYENFELTWQWKMTKAGGNGGLKYNLPNAKKGVGFEYQMLGDTKRNGEKHETASLYDLLPPDKASKLLPIGEWNMSRIIVDGSHVEHWINGTKAVEFEMGGEPLKDAIAKSKFKDTPGFGEKTKSPILLQDHNSEYAVRSMKIRVIEAAKKKG